MTKLPNLRLEKAASRFSALTVMRRRSEVLHDYPPLSCK
jgi:hypothetical protein